MFGSLRSGRPSTDVFNNVMVEAYGDTMPLSGLAQVSLRGAHTLVVTVHDEGLLQATHKVCVLFNGIPVYFNGESPLTHRRNGCFFFFFLKKDYLPGD